MRLIGIAGKAGSGKDTVAEHLVNNYGFARYALAGPIKKAVCAAFDLGAHVYEDRELKEKTLEWLGFSPRRLAQLLGTEFGRKLIADDVWLRVAQHHLDWLSSLDVCSGVVVSDIRYDNEAEWVHKNCGEVWLVHRPDVAVVESHSSEAGVDMALVNRVLPNTGTTAQLKLRTDAYLLAGFQLPAAVPAVG